MSKLYKIEFKEGVEEDLKSFDNAQKIVILKQIKKLQEKPELGEKLGNKYGYDLTGYRKMYANKKHTRIVYKIIEERIVVSIVAVGARDEMEVYGTASKRVGG